MPEDTCFKYLLTYKFSQDHLELFFNAVRQRGQCNPVYMYCVLCRATMFSVAGQGSPKPGLCPTLISNDLKGSL